MEEDREKYLFLFRLGVSCGVRKWAERDGTNVSRRRHDVPRGVLARADRLRRLGGLAVGPSALLHGMFMESGMHPLGIETRSDLYRVFLSSNE